MRVERLEIAGFKSFADPVTVSFPAGATAVVGPNGCGKSNIADAIFWVLGELGARTIRARGQDLIFSGNANRKPLGMAEVRLHVSGIERAASEGGGSTEGTVVVGRRVDRSGQSLYELDGRRTSRKEIVRLFAGTGLGSRSYALIEQGRMGEVLSRPPEELRRFIEAAAGLGRYRQNRKESEENLRAAERALAQVRQRMAELDTRIRQTRRESRQAGRARKLGAAIRNLEIAERTVRHTELERRIGEGRVLVARLGEEVSRRRRSLEVFERRLAAMRARRDALTADLREVTRWIGEVRRTEGEMEALVAEGDRASEARRSRRSRLAETEDGIRASRTARQEARAESGQRLDTARKNARETGAAASGRRAELEGARRDEGLAEEALEAARLAELRCRGAVRELGFRVEQHERSEEALRAADQRLEVERRELEARLARMEEQVRVAVREVDAQDAEAGEREERRRAAGTSHQERTEALEVARVRDAEAEKALGRVRARLESAEALIVSREQLGPATRKLLARARREGLDLPGAVGEELEVDEGYERAAERALAVHRLRVRRASEVSTLVRLAADGALGPWEVLVGEFVERDSGSGASPEMGGERLRVHVRSADPQLAAAIPDAVLVSGLEEALAAYARTPGHYVTMGGDSVSPPGIVRVGRGGPGEGFLAARRELSRLREEEAATRRTAEAEAREVRAAAAAAAEAGEERRRLAEAADEARRRSERLKARCEQAQRSRDEVRRRLAAVEAAASGNGEDRERNGEALARAREAVASGREELAAHGNRLEAAREAALACRRRTGEAERAWEDAERKANRGASEADRAQREHDAAERREAEDAKRLEELAGERADLSREDDEWEKRRKEAEAAAAAATARQRELVVRETDLAADERELSARLAVAAEPLLARRTELREVEGSRASAQAALDEAGRSRRELEDEFRSRFGASFADLAGTLPSGLADRSRADLLEEVDQVRETMRGIGPVNETAEARLAQLEAERARPAEELEDVEAGVRDGMKALARHDRDARQRFRAAYEAVERNFAEAFRQLFGGGRASLRLVEPEADEDREGAGPAPDDGVPTELAAGVEILAEPPGKKLRGIRLLSGGERAMTAIAFLIALFRHRPAPFCLLDEADAALDDQNVARFADLLGGLRQTTQLVVITHNRRTMESCDHLYGVTMEEPGVSRVVSLRLDDAVSSDWLSESPTPSSESLPA